MTDSAYMLLLAAIVERAQADARGATTGISAPEARLAVAWEAQQFLEAVVPNYVDLAIPDSNAGGR